MVDYTPVSITGGELRKDYPIDFPAARSYLRGLSTTLKGKTVNGTTTEEWGLKLNGSDPYLNVFFVEGADLSAATSMTINVPNGSVVLVNINGRGNDLNWSGGLAVNGTSIGNVLYNFYNTPNLTIQGIDVRGSILAPRTHVNFVTGVQNGQMMCKSLEGAGQFNNTQFIGNIPVETEIVNIASLSGVTETDTNPNNDSDDALVTVNGQDTGGGSGDGGEWEYVGSFLEGQIVWSLTYTEDGCLLVGTWGGAIYKSNPEGTEFTLINEGMNVGFIWSLLVHNGYFFAGTEQGVFRYNGVSWTLIGLEGMDIRSLVVADGVIYAGVWGAGVYVSTDDGETWTDLSADILNYAAVHDITAHFSFDFNLELFVATLGNGVCFSPDGGVNWTKLDVGYEFVWSIASTSAGTLFAGTYGDGLYQSDDNGSSWYKVIGIEASYIYDITVDADDNVYLSTLLGGVFVSIDGGSSFANVGMGGLGVSTLLVDLSKDKSGEHVIYAGTSDGTIYKKTTGSVTSLEEDSELPTEFTLSQNYPNPFNPSTQIEFSIPAVGNYQLKVFNIIGEEVASLVNNELAPGMYSVSFDASKLASGIYIYRLAGQSVNITKKMILMK